MAKKKPLADLLDILLGENKEYVCSECGEPMEFADDEVLVCTGCGHSVDVDDYGYEEEYEEYFSSINETDDKPGVCETCGGPYPLCVDGCKLFDD